MKKTLLFATFGLACSIGLSVQGSFPSHRKPLGVTGTNTPCSRKASLEALEGKNRWQIGEEAATERLRILAKAQRDAYEAINQEKMPLCSEQKGNQEKEKALLLRRLSFFLASFNGGAEDDETMIKDEKVDWSLLELRVKHEATPIQDSPFLSVVNGFFNKDSRSSYFRVFYEKKFMLCGFYCCFRWQLNSA